MTLLHLAIIRYDILGLLNTLKTIASLITEDFQIMLRH